MPNWVFNTVTIKGNKEDIKRVKEQVSKPFTMPNRDWKTDEVTIVEVNPTFSFWNIVRAPEDKLELYYETNGSKKDPITGEMVRTGDTEWNWYNFNNREWGTKWDVSNDATLEDEAKDYLIYRFDTAWAPPVGALNALSLQYPNLEISNEWEEEQGFGSTMIHKNGEEEEFDGYDWKCGDCDFLYCGDPSAIWDEETYETMCPKCHPDWVKKPETEEVDA